MTLQPIVEGYGEVEALPLVLRRLQEVAESYHLKIGRPIRRKRAELVAEQQVKRAVRLALGQPDCVGVLIVFDSDGDCPAEVGPQVQRWAQNEAVEVPCQVVLTHHEFEAWFLGALESLRGVRRIFDTAVSVAEPEAIAGCKERLCDWMPTHQPYSPAVDQAALANAFSLAAAHRTCRSFRKLVSAFGNLASAAGAELQNWPPGSW
jgi:hypothetical protein